MINTRLLHRTLAHIATHPEEWDQRRYAIATPGTAPKLCFAARAIKLAGVRFEYDSLTGLGSPKRFDVRLMFPGFDPMTPDRGNLTWTGCLASYVLGIDGYRLPDPLYRGTALDHQSPAGQALFHSGNTMSDLLWYCQLLWAKAANEAYRGVTA